MIVNIAAALFIAIVAINVLGAIGRAMAASISESMSPLSWDWGRVSPYGKAVVAFYAILIVARLCLRSYF